MMRKFLAMLLVAAMLLTSAAAFAEPAAPSDSVEETAKPAEEPKTDPSEKPSTDPSEEPSAAPSEKPSTDPSEEPSTEPSEEPSIGPSEEPTTVPSKKPTSEPTTAPTTAPTETPSDEPTVAPEETAAPEDERSPIVAKTATAEEKETWWNILLLGGDSRSTESYDRTDSMIILSVNRKTGQIKMTSVMRDTWVSIPGHKGMAKINAANVYGGPERAVETVNNCFGTEIEDYVLVNMDGLVKVIDAVGGVDIEITDVEREHINGNTASYLSEIGKSYSGATSVEHSGMVHLNGLLALSYARIRHADSDYKRAMRQQTVLMALAQKASAMSTTELLKLVPTLLGMTETNLSMGEAMALATMCAGADMSEIPQYRIPADGTYTDGMFGDTWCIKPNFEKNARLLHDFIYTATED